MAAYSNPDKVINADGIFISVYFALIFIGWLMITAVGFSDSEKGTFSLTNALLTRDTMWYVVAIVAFVVGLIIEHKFWNSFSWILYGVSLVLLLAVLVFGREIKGATSWFVFGGFSFQPSEFAKWATITTLATYLGMAGVKVTDRRQLFISLAIVILPILLILLQPDAGSALIFTSLAIVFYRAGVAPSVFVMLLSLVGVVIGSLLVGTGIIIPVILLACLLLLAFQQKRPTPFLAAWALLALFSLAFINYIDKIYIAGALAVVFAALSAYTVIKVRYQPVLLTAILAVSAFGISFSTDFAYNNVLRPHQQDRINVWLHPEKCDPQGSLYNVNQSKTAIGSGGFLGKGFLEGNMTKLNYVPEQSTDFIFSTLGEEQGFIGVVGVIVLFFILLVRMTIIGERAKNNFIKYYAYGMASMLFFQVFVNIGMTMGVMPVIGIPLPFISKGGTSLVIYSLMMGILMRMDFDRNKR